MTKLYNFKKGRRGEEIAASYLKNKGFKILEQNFRTRFGEIDLIASKNSVLHFIEVKLKVGDRFGSPEDMINRNKIMQVVKTAQAYMLINHISKTISRTQVDAVCVVLNDKKEVERLNYYENMTVNM